MEKLQDWENTQDLQRESSTGQIDELLKQKLESCFHESTSKVHLHDLIKVACEHSSIDLAIAAYHLPPTVRPLLFEHLPDCDAKVKFLVNTDSETRLILFRQFSESKLQKIFERMPTDEAVWVVEDMPERKFRRLMELIDIKKATRIRELKKHGRKSAGRLMSSEFFAFPMEMTVAGALVHVRDNPRIDCAKGIFICTSSGELQGFIPTRNMMITAPNTPLRQVMRPVLHKVTPDATREEVIDLVERYKISSLPVVDEKDSLVGVIAYEDIVEAMEDLADETIARIGGTDEKCSVHESIFRRFLTRAPWLLVTLCAGLINVGVMASFQQKTEALLTFAMFFVPLINGLSGNIGLQCSTVLVRMMAMGGFSSSRRRSTILKELLSGLLIGGFFSIGCVFLVWLFHFFGGLSFASVAILGLGLIGGCVAGTLLGVFSPLLFARIGVDPAIAAGPVVTACNDFLSMTIYFLIAQAASTLFF
ncbi:MAG: magnesium transporter [Verrucomicrobiota bacterium]|nr:magnesium transporter [Verrucomicrobiota bacterium]